MTVWAAFSCSSQCYEMHFLDFNLLEKVVAVADIQYLLCVEGLQLQLIQDLMNRQHSTSSFQNGAATQKT